jgi:RND family efflux transporter MFP subunit
MCHQRTPRRRFAAGLALLLFTPLGFPARADEPEAGKVVLEVRGYVVPVRQVTVSPAVAGQVVEMNVEEGQVVAQGAVLARLDDREYRANLEVARARLALAVARQDKARAAADEKDLAVAAAEVALARAEVDRVQLRLEATVVRAPVAGTVLLKKAEVGCLVNPAAFNVAASICEMADLRNLEVDVAVPEGDAGAISKGQPCLIRLEAFPKTVYKGRVSRLLPIAHRAKGALQVRVKIDVPDKDTQLRPDMGATVSFLAKDAR